MSKHNYKKKYNNLKIGKELRDRKEFQKPSEKRRSVILKAKYKEEKNKSDETGFELIDKSYQWPPNNVSNEELDRQMLAKKFFELNK